LNTFLRPLVIALTLPINILSFGLFTLIINGFFFYLAAKFVKGFTVMNFWNAFWASIVFSIISFVLNIILTPTAGFSVRSYTRAPDGRTKKHTDAIDVEAKVGDCAESRAGTKEEL